MNKPILSFFLLFYGFTGFNGAQETDMSVKIDKKDFNPATLLWYDAPAKELEEVLPVENGRLGAMVFVKFGEKRIHLNEDTYWTGGPYSTVAKGGAEFLPQIQKYIFKGKCRCGYLMYRGSNQL